MSKQQVLCHLLGLFPCGVLESIYEFNGLWLHQFGTTYFFVNFATAPEVINATGTINLFKCFLSKNSTGFMNLSYTLGPIQCTMLNIQFDFKGVLIGNIFGTYQLKIIKLITGQQSTFKIRM